MMILRAQDDCTLNIGGEETAILIEVFQLNAEQRSQLEVWITELQEEQKSIEADIEQLLAIHPQSTEADLQNLAKKYNTLQQELFAVSAIYDQKLLGIFNERQYAFYLELCEEAVRRPLNPIPPEEED